MRIAIRPLHPIFGAEIQGVDIGGPLEAAVIGEIRSAIDQYSVLVFRDQHLNDDAQVSFAQRFGPLENYGTLNSRKRPPRVQRPEIADVSNLTAPGQIYAVHSKQRANNLANQLWHTDSSFKFPPGHLSMLAAYSVPSWGGETEFCDLRAAYDTLPDRIKPRIEGLVAEHSIVYSRAVVGFEEFPEHVRNQLPPVAQPLVRTHPESGRKTLYLAAHASHILGMPVPDGRLLLRDLIEHATQRDLVYSHSWRPRDLVIWDNRCTMHRGRPFDESEPRDVRRVTTVDVQAAASRAA